MSNPTEALVSVLLYSLHTTKSTAVFALSDNRSMELELHQFSRLSEAEFQASIRSGTRYVVYQYAMSVVVYAFMQHSKVHVVPPGRSIFLRGLPYSLVTVILGWWAIPAGPVFTLRCLAANLRGGHDVSAEILEHIRRQDVRYQYGLR